MIKIRLERAGVRRKPVYRIVVVEDSQKKGGRKLEVLGFWHPAKESKTKKPSSTKKAKPTKKVSSVTKTKPAGNAKTGKSISKPKKPSAGKTKKP